MTQAAIAKKQINGFDPAALEEAVAGIATAPETGKTRWNVRCAWQGGTRVRTRVDGFEMGGQRIERSHTIECDEPNEVFGHDSAPNPQELLLASVGSCMSVVYALNAAVMGIAIEKLEIELGGRIDMRGPLGLDENVLPGFPEVDCRVYLRANASQAALEELHSRVQALSPNFYHLTKAIPTNARLFVEQ